MFIILKQSRWLLAVFVTLAATQAFGHGISEAERQGIIEGGNIRYIWIGATHMFTGYDHLAFIFGMIFFLTCLKDIVKYITAFTLGHSVTLIFATFNAVQINYFLIDAVIALSVCYIAFANLKGFEKYLKINPPNMLMMIIALGLVHGLGLSTRLQEFPLNKDHLLMNIISFNLGIELGQIAALALMLLAITFFRRSRTFPTFSTVTNYALILAGLCLFLIQMHGYLHTGNLEELAVSAESSTEVERTQEAASREHPEASRQSEWRDTVSITIPAAGHKEYSFLVAEGKTFEYRWQTDGKKLYFDFHAEPKGDTTGYFESFGTGIDSQSSGSFTTSFAGTHGWYWKNIYPSPVVITLKAKGDYKRLD